MSLNWKFFYKLYTETTTKFKDTKKELWAKKRKQILYLNWKYRNIIKIISFKKRNEMCYLSIQTEQMLLPGNWWFSEREAQLLMLFLCVFYMYMQLRLCWTTTNQSSETTFIFSSKRSSYFLLVCAHAHLFHFLTCELHFQELVKQFSTALMFFLVIWQYPPTYYSRCNQTFTKYNFASKFGAILKCACIWKISGLIILHQIAQKLYK